MNLYYLGTFHEVLPLYNVHLGFEIKQEEEKNSFEIYCYVNRTYIGILMEHFKNEYAIFMSQI